MAAILPNRLKFEDVGELKVMLTEIIFVISTILFFEWTESHADSLESWNILIIPIGILLIGLGIGAFKKLLK